METITILDLPDEAVRKDTEWYYRDKKNAELFEEAKEVIRVLGLGGIWRGHYSAVRVVYDALIKYNIPEMLKTMKEEKTKE